MKSLAACALAICALTPTFAATNVGISIGIHQPGVYGRIDIGNEPSPEVVYAEPIIIAPAPMASRRRPIYLYVPPNHQRHWERYCDKYRACGQPVYFVQDKWVRERYQQEHEHERGNANWQRDERRGHGNQGSHDRGEHGRQNKH